MLTLGITGYTLEAEMIENSIAKRSNSMDDHILPENLYSGDVLVSKQGDRVTVQRTSFKNDEGERLYRLRFSSGILGNGRYTRDELQATGCRLLEKARESGFSVDSDKEQR